VKLLGTDGAAGMAAIVTENELDFALFRDPPLAASCRRYTRLLFLRAVGSRPPRHSNNTKADLSRDGYDPTVTSDAIYFDDAAKGRFVGLHRALYGRPQAGKVRI
jgi:hypothetical protein